MEPTRGFLSQEFYNMPGVGALYSRVSTYVFGDWNKCGELMGLAPYGRPERINPLLTLEDGQLHVPDWSNEFRYPWLVDSPQKWEDNPAMQHWEDLARPHRNNPDRLTLARTLVLRPNTAPQH